MLLVHTCCAHCTLKLFDCSQPIFKDLSKVDLYYYAPNIHPRSEYLARLKALKKIIKTKDLACQLIVANYQPKDYFLVLKKELADLTCPKFGQRCQLCWQLRLEKSFIYAKENNYQQLTSTMLSSSYMDREQIFQLAKNLAKKYQLEFIFPKFKCNYLATKGFYKQNYCGCCYSLVERMKEKY